MAVRDSVGETFAAEVLSGIVDDLVSGKCLMVSGTTAVFKGSHPLRFRGLELVKCTV